VALDLLFYTLFKQHLLFDILLQTQQKRMMSDIGTIRLLLKFSASYFLDLCILEQYYNWSIGSKGDFSG
jgi:hypothetical protein